MSIQLGLWVVPQLPLIRLLAGRGLNSVNCVFNFGWCSLYHQLWKFEVGMHAHIYTHIRARTHTTTHIHTHHTHAHTHAHSQGIIIVYGLMSALRGYCFSIINNRMTLRLRCARSACCPVLRIAAFLSIHQLHLESVSGKVISRFVAL